ncbi:MAG: hypothetical protein ACKOCD_11510 [Nitrospiraceae bacterium]
MARHRAIKLRRTCNTLWMERASGQAPDRDMQRAGRSIRARTRIIRRRWRCPKN